jgi:hypothetical protein
VQTNCVRRGNRSVVFHKIDAGCKIRDLLHCFYGNFKSVFWLGHSFYYKAKHLVYFIFGKKLFGRSSTNCPCKLHTTKLPQAPSRVFAIQMANWFLYWKRMMVSWMEYLWFTHLKILLVCVNKEMVVGEVDQGG